MTKVFVHGNPETDSVWSELTRELRARGVDDILLLSPPGFGAPIPPGFGGTALDHRDWLIRELEGLSGPVDLVGHDWGAGHVYAVAAERPDLLRTWTADCSGIIHPDYVWHPGAQVWQTPGEGERSVAELIELTAEELAAGHGVPEQHAPDMAKHLDEEMGRAILAVYRSAAQPVMRQLGDRLARAERRPALIVQATEDAFTNPEFTGEVAARVGAQVLILEGAGHWWMFEQSDKAADGLVSFWREN